jgi:hypothetical protein
VIDGTAYCIVARAPLYQLIEPRVIINITTSSIGLFEGANQPGPVMLRHRVDVMNGMTLRQG